MQVADIKYIISKGLTERVLFGSDFPINKHFFPEQDTTEWYQERIKELSIHFGKEIFNVFNKNFIRVFNSFL